MADLTVVMAGGGSAGHVNPLVATASALQESGASVIGVGTKEGLETTLVPAAGIPLELVDKAPFPRRPNLDLFRFPSRYSNAVRQAGKILDDSQADVAVGFGGFASTPIYAAARTRGIPVVIHEQNAKAGLANRYGARFARAVALTFPSTNLAAKSGKTQVVGLPLRPAIAELAGAGDRADRRVAAAQRLGLDPGRTTLVVTGGSLGALHLNEAFIRAMPALADFQVFHLTGRGKAGPVEAAAGTYPSYRVRDYLSEMEDAYAVADLVVCRSGAGTVAELSALGLPGFFVPLPIGNGEQELNAKDVVAAGGARLVRDKDFTAETISGEILDLLAAPEELRSMGERARGICPVDGAHQLAALIEEIGVRNS